MTLRLSVHVLETTIKPTDTLSLVAVVTNDSNATVDCPTTLAVMSCVSSGDVEAPNRGSSHTPNIEKHGARKPAGHCDPLGAGESRTFTHPIDCELHAIWNGNTSASATLAGVVACDEIQTRFDHAFTLDLSDTKRLTAPDGTFTFFFASGKHLLFSHPARGYHEGRATHTLSKAQRTAIEILSPEYARFGGKKVFRCQGLVRGCDGDSFQVLSRTFAKDKAKVYSLYGDADVRDPASFDALPPPTDGAHPIYDQIGWGQSGYGRDAQFLYFFDRDTESAKARIIKSCKAPDRFVALSDLVGHDGQRVFYRGQIIKGADPDTFEVLNDGYSRDTKRVYFAADPLDPPADPALFDVVPDSVFASDPRPPRAYADKGRSGDTLYQYSFLARDD